MDPTRNIRAEIAKNLHDGLGQHMLGIMLAARALETKLTRKKNPETDEAAYLVEQLRVAQLDISNLLSWLDEGRPR